MSMSHSWLHSIPLPVVLLKYVWTNCHGYFGDCFGVRDSDVCWCDMFACLLHFVFFFGLALFFCFALVCSSSGCYAAYGLIYADMYSRVLVLHGLPSRVIHSLRSWLCACIFRRPFVFGHVQFGLSSICALSEYSLNAGTLSRLALGSFIRMFVHGCL